MRRTTAVFAALGIALATAASAWAITVNTGIVGERRGVQPVSARTEAENTPVPSPTEVVETVYYDVPVSDDSADAAPASSGSQSRRGSASSGSSGGGGGSSSGGVSSTSSSGHGSDDTKAESTKSDDHKSGGTSGGHPSDD